MQITKVCLSAAFLLAPMVSSHAAVSAEEAKQLGKNLTPWGAEKAGNAAKTIPEWTGQPKAPASYVPGSGKWPNPFPGDKPLYSINAQNMQQYAASLSEGQKELMKRYPSFRMDVYQSRRTFDQPTDISDNCYKNAVNGEAYNDGLSVKNVYGCIPFPIPKTGREAMWNHLMNYKGRDLVFDIQAWYVDANGRAIQSLHALIEVLYPFAHAGKNAEYAKTEWGNNWYVNNQSYVGPARFVGEGVVTKYNADPVSVTNKSWTYQPGQRRVRATPDTFYDFPVAQLGGACVYDDVQMYNGMMDRFDFKLLGKKEMYIPYNPYDLILSKAEKLLTKNHMNPDLVRWELHRTWVVELTLKPEFRHIYSKRIYYLDEDNPGIGIGDLYDTSGKLYRFAWDMALPMFDEDKSQFNSIFGLYDFSNGVYVVSTIPGEEGYVKPLKKISPPSNFTPQFLQTKMQR